MSNAPNSVLQVSPGALVTIKGEDGIAREAMMVSPIMINIPDESEVEVMFLDKNTSSESQKKS